ncbi:hypothetical protein, partial [Acidovorax sp. Leaf160]|uniref:hypothetical protein n=1 Tax=Acidovorax sp. Leaf160 TaxID=1736280 RepID=UPI001F20726D
PFPAIRLISEALNSTPVFQPAATQNRNLFSRLPRTSGEDLQRQAHEYMTVLAAVPKIRQLFALLSVS